MLLEQGGISAHNDVISDFQSQFPGLSRADITGIVTEHARSRFGFDVMTGDPYPSIIAAFARALLKDDDLLGKLGDVQREQAENSMPQCFPADTKIRLVDGTSISIQDIASGQAVASFDEASALQLELTGSRVSMLFENVADQFIELSFADPQSGQQKFITSTIGHVFLTVDGKWKRLCDMINQSHVFGSSNDLVEVDFSQDRKSTLPPSHKIAEHAAFAGETQIVLADGSIVDAVAYSVKYTVATADLYEQAEMFVARTEHGLAIEPEFITGWKTYNFEVESTHTYIAEGVRVHNTSGFGTSVYGVDASFAGTGLAAINDVLSGAASARAGGVDSFAYSATASEPTAVGYDASTGWTSVTSTTTDGRAVNTVTTLSGLTTVNYGSDPFGGGTTGGLTGAISGFVSAVAEAVSGLFSPESESGGAGKPILIDLDGDGVEVLPENENFVLFDFDDDGFQERTGLVPY